MDNKEKEERENNPREGANIFSILTFAWLYKIFQLRHTRELDSTDLYKCLKVFSSQTLGKLLSKIWNKEEKKFKENNVQKLSLLRILLRYIGKHLIMIGLCQAFNELFLKILQVILLSKILSYLNDKNEMSGTEIYFWASGFVICLILCNCIDCHCAYTAVTVEMKLRISCSRLVYRKCLRLARASVDNSDATIGQIINVLSNDINNFNNSFFCIHYIWIAPIQAIIVMIIIYQQMNMVSFVGTLIILILILLQGHIGKWMKHLTYKLSLRTDKRLSLMEEIISGVQAIKMYAWEKSFARLVDKARGKEINVIRKLSFIDAIIICLDIYIPRFCVYAIIFFYVLFESHISVEQVYLVTAFYNILRSSINVCMTLAIQRSAKCLVTIKRINKLLIRDEIQKTIPKNLGNQTSDPNIAIKLYKIFAKWSPQIKQETLKNLSFTAQHGSLSAIIGQVGSGKSSLLHLLLDELPLSSGSIQVSGKVAYVSQEPWIFASSIRQNILFGLPMNKDRYQKVIQVCQLEKDFAMFPLEDRTLIGEKGITLSGGQKARINLARAVYSNADIYLLDDPLSSVDDYVSRRIFEDCICGYLKGKTRIFVTHQLQYLKSVDRIFILNNGFMEMEGSFAELSNNRELDWMKLLAIKDDDNVADQITNKMENIDKEDQSTALRRDSEDQEAEEIHEHRIVGKTSVTVYLSYFKAAESIWILFLVVILGILYQVFATSGDIFLARWVDTAKKGTSETSSSNFENTWYIQIYSLLTLTTIILVHAFYLVFCEMCMRSSQNLHHLMFFSIMRTTMSFFHANPAGRILNRFSKDIGAVDTELPIIMMDIAQSFLQLAAIITINCFINLWFLIPTGIIGSVFYILRVFYMRTSRSLKRLEAIHRSPIFSHVSATLQGLTTIRALMAENILTEEFDNYQNIHSSAWYLFSSCVFAFIFYLQFFSSFYIALIIYLFVSIGNNVSAGDAGLVITQSILLANMFFWGLKQTTEMEVQMTCVERILQYSDLDQEPPLETKPENKPPDQWPSEGHVEFKDVSLSYKPSGALVLQNLNFVILTKEKIGIVGRTGTGKSSLLAALFRLAYMKGEIYIDGVATGDLGLHDVRSNISIIPQEPLLFTGSLRRNLDPFDNYSDDELWQALEEVELKDFIRNLYAKLYAKVSNGGSNFSVGQRQLLCLARAIVRKNKILVLDEATANVDLKTDELIQKTIRRRFKDCTVFIIAHRLNTVMDCDKFIVMDSGSMVEFDHPRELLKKKEGYLYKMVQESGPEMADILTRMAENKYQ